MLKEELKKYSYIPREIYEYMVRVIDDTKGTNIFKATNMIFKKASKITGLS